MKRIIILLLIITTAAMHKSHAAGEVRDTTLLQQAQRILAPYIIKQATWAMQQEPLTVTAFTATRSAGGKHDFYSEGDYWWPDPQNPDGPYIQRDGQTNPDNFVAHRHAMIRFSKVVGSLAAAFQLTGDPSYAQQVLRHCRAWFVDTATRMNPHLLYAQAIKGRATGRGIGIIDAVHLMEVVKGLQVIERAGKVQDEKVFAGSRNWFSAYLHWITTHSYGKDEMQAANNHGTCWVMQVAVFSNYTKNDTLLKFCRDRYKQVLLPNQMETDGSFPLELKRTKPYGYSIFNLDAMATICQELSMPGDDLWQYTLSNERSIGKGISFLYPYIVNKNTWAWQKDVMYWEQWPVAQPFLIFGAIALQKPEWFQTWQGLEHDPAEEEVIRNLPVRNPTIWFHIDQTYNRQP